MGSQRATDQIQDDRKTLGTYPIMVTVTVRVRAVGRYKLPTALAYTNNYLLRQIIVKTIVYYDCLRYIPVFFKCLTSMLDTSTLLCMNH